MSAEAKIVLSMFGVIVAAILLASVGSCRRHEQVQKATHTPTVVTIDSCQYLRFEAGTPGYRNHVLSITHKGDCDNPIHTVPLPVFPK